jgi:hypothetical protein
MKDGLDLKGPALLGRTIAEYAEYFSLSDFDLNRESILDMGAGVSSFCAEASRRGYSVVAADPAYGLSVPEIARKCEADLQEVVAQLPSVMHKYTWKFYRDGEHLREFRENAYRAFLSDYANHPDRYVKAALPTTPFSGNQFTVSLVSYFLFLYEDQLDYEFHKSSVLELARVTQGEVRIYPLTNLRAERSWMVRRLMTDSGCAGLSFEVRRIGFEFLKNANELLIIRKSAI